MDSRKICPTWNHQSPIGYTYLREFRVKICCHLSVLRSYFSILGILSLAVSLPPTAKSTPTVDLRGLVLPRKMLSAYIHILWLLCRNTHTIYRQKYWYRKCHLPYNVTNLALCSVCLLSANRWYFSASISSLWHCGHFLIRGFGSTLSAKNWNRSELNFKYIKERFNRLNELLVTSAGV